MSNTRKITVTDTILRDAHQSLLATRLRTEDMLPICDKLDQVGYWSLEVWGGATFDACVRFLKEDPWERLRTLRKALPNTRLQMLLRGQNLLGYRHYSDDVVRAFVAKAAENGIDVFRIFASTPRAPSPIPPARCIRLKPSCSRPRTWQRWASIPSPSRTWPVC